MRVGLFVTCVVDLMRPEIGFSALKLLKQAGCDVVVPPAQTCCGQPAYNSGERAIARDLAEKTLAEFESLDYVVVPSGSCGGMIRVHYGELFRDDPELMARYGRLRTKVYELTDFLVNVARVTLERGAFKGPVTYHDSCSGLRELGVKNPIGFFLHIPFPSPEVLRTVPPHEELMKFMCAYDVIGLQTESDKQAFVDYIERRGLGTSSEDGILHAHGRVVKVAAYPIGIYPDAIGKAAIEYGSRKAVKALRDTMRERKLVISVDRLDYSKGLVERFQAFERMLANAPGWQGRVSLVQIAPPTRSDVQTYQRIRQTLEGEAGRINGRFAQLDWTPIQYLNRKYERNLLMALFRLSQVGYVTPLRDGMNLVAKEYVASQDPNDPGVLVLSEFAGAAAELPGALLVNPFDLSQMAESLERALAMPLEERQARHAENIARLRKNDLSVWRDSFLTDVRSGATAASVTQRAGRRVANA